jgi:hypothetical protein
MKGLTVGLEAALKIKENNTATVSALPPIHA